MPKQHDLTADSSIPNSERLSSRESELDQARYRQMFEKNRAIKLLLDPESGAILDANQAAANFYGYSIERLKSLKISHLNTLDAAEVAAEMKRAAAGKPKYFTFQHKIASGEVRDVEVHSSPVHYGDEMMLYAIVHDITERRRAEEEVMRLNANLERLVAERTAQLEASNRELEREITERKALEEVVAGRNKALQTEYGRLAMVIGSVDISLSVLDREGRILLVNDAWSKRTNLTQEQAIGVLYGEISTQPGGSQVQELIDRVVETGLPYQERELRLPNEQFPGGSLYVDGSILPIRDDKGNITNLLTVSIDVTEKVLTRREVEAQRAQLSAIIENSPISIAVYDRDLRIMNANRAWSKLEGVEHEQVIGRTLYELFEKSHQLRPYFAQALAGKEVNRTSVPGLDAGKTETRYYDVSYIPMKDSRGNVDGILSITVDTTERELLNKQKDQFIATASHELKSPITVIKGYVQMSARAAARLGDQSLVSRLQAVVQQTDRLTRMIDDLLDVSRMQEGALTLSKCPIDLNETLREVVRGAEAVARDFTFDLELPEEPVIVEADRDRIEQVITNLLQNAVKYSGKSRQIEVKLEVDAKEGMAVTSVRDYGVGIPAAQQQHIFDRFYRASNVRASHSGFGLGLFIAQGIVTHHGGDISLQSVEGEGSTFAFTLPLSG